MIKPLQGMSVRDILIYLGIFIVLAALAYLCL